MGLRQTSLVSTATWWWYFCLGLGAPLVLPHITSRLSVTEWNEIGGLAVVAISVWLAYLWGCRVHAGAYILYRLDVVLSRQRAAKVLLFVVMTLVLLLLAAGILCLLDEGVTFTTAMWQSWHWLADPSEMFQTQPRLFAVRALSCVTTLVGVVVFALLIGIVSDHLGEFVEGLQKGTAEIVVQGHTVLLNFNSKGLPIILELLSAKQSEGGGTIVVMSDTPKAELEAIILDALGGDFKGSRVICRCGSTRSEYELSRLSLPTAKSIIVLASTDTADSTAVGGGKSLHTVLQVLDLLPKAVMSQKGEPEIAPGSPWLVVEVNTASCYAAFSALRHPAVNLVVAHQLAGRILLNSALQANLGDAVAELVSFSGVEIYVKDWPELCGLQFHEILFAFDGAVPIGFADEHHTYLNPGGGRVLRAGEKVVLIAADDDTYHLKTETERRKTQAPSRRTILPMQRSCKEELDALFVNWHPDMRQLLLDFDALVSRGSSVTLYARMDTNSMRHALAGKGRGGKLTLRNLSVKFQAEETAKDLYSLDALEKLPLEEYDVVVIFAEVREGQTNDHVAAEQLRTTLLTRLIQSTNLAQKLGHKEREGKGAQDLSRHDVQNDPTFLASRRILVEAKDMAGQYLIDAVKRAEVINTNKISASVLAQVSEQSLLTSIYRELLCGLEGSELYFKPAERYVTTTERCNWTEIRKRAWAFSEIAIGYQLAGEVQCTLDPTAAAKCGPRLWHPDDRIFVLAEEF